MKRPLATRPCFELTPLCRPPTTTWRVCINNSFVLFLAGLLYTMGLHFQVLKGNRALLIHLGNGYILLIHTETSEWI